MKNINTLIKNLTGAIIKRKRASIAVFLLIALIFSLGRCSREMQAKKEEAAIPVKAMKVELKDLNLTLEYVGNIKGRDEATVYPKVSGKIAEKVKEDGSPIAKGETIVYIDRDEVGLKFEKAPVESPLAGIIGRIYVDIGSNVTPQTPVALVVDMEGVKIELNIPEKYIPKLSLSQNAVITVDAYADEKFTGQVSKISPVIDIDTRTAPVEISITDEKHLLKSGMFAKAKLTIEEHKNVPIILKEAIMGKNSDTYVFVAKDNKVAMRKVSLGIRQGPYFEVTEGLKDGDLVVVMGQQRLRDGANVTVEIYEETYNL